MQLFFQSLFVFFGTLIAAAVVALGEPARADLLVASPHVNEAPATQHAQR